MAQELPFVFADITAFLIALSAYTKINPGADDPHTKAAVILLRRFQGETAQGFQEVLLPMTTEPYLMRFKSRVTLAGRSMAGLDFALEQAEIAQEVFAVLRAHPDKIKATFTDQRAVTAVTRIALAASSEDPQGILNTLSTIQSASSLRVTRTWIRRAAELVGAAPSAIEVTLADANEASSLGQDLKVVDSLIDKADPSSAQAAELQETRGALLSRIQGVANESPAPAVVFSAAAQAASGPRENATKIGAELRLNADKEAAMMLRGKGVIAAGAGSGKTMTLAAKVVYHIKELGVPAGSIIATSFTRKAAAELLRRINKYGGDIPDHATGFGTSHSIAAKIMHAYGSDLPDEMKSYVQTDLFSLAMKQVQMGPFGIPIPPPTSIFASSPPVSSVAPPTPAAPSVPQPATPSVSVVPSLSFNAALKAAFAARGRLVPFLQNFISGYFDPSHGFYYGNRSKTKNFTDPAGLTDSQKKILQEIFQKTGVTYNVYGRGRMAGVKKDQALSEKYNSAKTPARQWFNIGNPLVDERGQPVPLGSFKNFVSKRKGRLISPTEAWALAKGDPEQQAMAAVYGAYEYLKGPQGEPALAGGGDGEDVFISLSKMMLSNPNTLRSIQNRFKVILVDEAQDLNRAQHVAFGLIAGFVDPAKVAKVAFAKSMGDLAKDDGTMTADTYTFIGDDKQAIYDFRGADPEAFIDMSDLIEGGVGFKTEVLKTNYRSGALIVQAANRLIAHNKKQIPMTCDANPKRVDQGGVTTIPFSPQDPNDMSEPAEWLAEQIEHMVENGQTGSKGYDYFGVGLRTNAEAYTYGLELLKKGIPFRSKANFFKDQNTKALLAWLTIVDEGESGSVDRINAAVLAATAAPLSMLGKAFLERVTAQATGNYLTWLRDNYESIYGPSARYTATIEAFVRNLEYATTLKGGKGEEILAALLKMKGVNGQSVSETLVDAVREDADVMAELRAESPDGKVSSESVTARAFAPIDPLLGLLGARADLTEAMKFVRTLQKANEKLAAGDDPEAKGFANPAVTLGTVHSWKGLEVGTMFVPFVGGKFPRANSTEEDLSAERRLAYVAITRAEDQLFIMDIPTVINTKKGPIVRNSQFVSETCAPVQSPEGSLKMGSADGIVVPEGWSPFDEAVMQAYLRGEDPFAVKVSNPDLDSEWGETLFGGEEV